MKTEHELSLMQEFTESMFYAAFLKADEERGRAILEEEAAEKKSCPKRREGGFKGRSALSGPACASGAPAR